jgi:hypothetical protein
VDYRKCMYTGTCIIYAVYKTPHCLKNSLSIQHRFHLSSYFSWSFNCKGILIFFVFFIFILDFEFVCSIQFSKAKFSIELFCILLLLQNPCIFLKGTINDTYIQLYLYVPVYLINLLDLGIEQSLQFQKMFLVFI